MAVGAAIGVVLAIAIVAPVRFNGIPFFAAVGLAKLTFLAALGFLAAGAVARRVGLRQARRDAASVAGPNEDL